MKCALFMGVASLLTGCGVGLIPPPDPVPFVIGQTSLTAAYQNERSFLSPGDIVRVGNKLIVSDYYGGRVLIWNTVPSGYDSPPDLVIGKPSTTVGTTPTESDVNGRNIGWAGGVATDGTRFVVSDPLNHRALVWHTFPTASYQAADVVLGQPDFTTHTANYGGLGPSSFNTPNGVGINGGKLFIGDYDNKRILVWNTFPTLNNTTANFVIGQDDFVSSASACAANRFNVALQGRFTFDGGKLFVADTNRVMVFNTVPSASGPTANFAIGKPNLTDCTNGTTAALTSSVYGVTVANGKLALADWGNNRVLLFNTVPSADGASANAVLGQTVDTASAPIGCDGVINAKAIMNPVNVLFDGTKLFVADWLFGFSVMTWNSFPAANCTAANSILGQPDFTTRKPFYGGSPARQFAAQDFYLKDRLIVPDYWNNRVLMWSPLPTGNSDATLTVGTPHVSQATPATNANTLLHASATDSDGTHLAVADSGWNRVLLWNTLPESTAQNADLILGQPTTVVTTENTGGLSGAALKSPGGVLLAEGKLLVADSGNNRVLIWNSVPLVTGTAADVVIGQVSFLANSANQGGPASSRTLSNPTGLAYYQKKLFVADENNHRVLVFAAIPNINNVGASIVLGQGSFSDVSANAGGAAGASTLNLPHGLSVDNLYLWVADARNHRVLNFSLSTLAIGMKAKNAYGQPNLTTVNLPVTPAEKTFLNPRKAVRRGQFLYVLDDFQRIVATPFVF